MARIVVVAPGRGSYNRTELGYLNRFDAHRKFDIRREYLATADRLRQSADRCSISELDGAEAYASSKHLPGENASGLIFTCAAADYGLLHESHDIVATLGNSMGWYITLFTGGALSFEDTFRVVDTMGAFQKGNVQGGQLIYPIVDDNWQHDPEREAAAMAAVERVSAKGEAYWAGLSIRLGGFLVLAGTRDAVRTLLTELPPIQMGANTYPFQLSRHGAFHTPIMQAASDHGLANLGDVQWRQPEIPMIDGRGHIWRKYRTDRSALLNYTLSTQVLEPYDFTLSVRVALREYNPDHVVLLGPGETLGGSIAQVMIRDGWRGLRNKADFMAAQKSANPPLIAMNRPDQARLVI